MKVLRDAIKAGAEIVYWGLVILAVSAFFGLIQITVEVKGTMINNAIPILVGGMFILGAAIRLFCRFILITILVTKPKDCVIE
jgi:hypothetical protein